METITDSWHLPDRYLGQRVLVFDSLASTNTHALELAGQPDTDGLAILADVQLAGRGQHGRRWLASPRSSVLLSVLLYPPASLTRPVLLTAWAAVCVCELAHELTGVTPRIKWPNDVQLQGRKVCGILIEQSRLGDQMTSVVGIGLNVTQTDADFQAAELPEATSLTAMGATERDTHVVAKRLLELLDREYARLLAGDHLPLETLWKRHLGLCGEDVIVETLTGSHEGQLLTCGFNELVLFHNVKLQAIIQPEAVLHIRRR